MSCKSVGLSAVAQKKVMKELRSLMEEPCADITVSEDGCMSQISAEVAGPEGTPYEGGIFRLRLVLPHDFPETPPRGYFQTRIFHPNVSSIGEICVNVLKKDWKSSMGLRHILQIIRCLLIEPFPESALNEEAGRLFMDDYQEYFRQASMWTRLHGSSCSSSGRLSRPLASIESNALASENDERAVYNQSGKSLNSPLSPARKSVGNWGVGAENLNMPKQFTGQTKTPKKRNGLRRL
eukprot:TRINITY_DN8039_c2_g1_i3.p2 TRINITY_DN8039_c2_g1~~TRINITY_DN8039_c2_g1_i3.p2  ORF type:complete len:237 (+),score=37.23 TRINITY_DN8039_c2_g1_i3:266-976(+)